MFYKALPECIKTAKKQLRKEKHSGIFGSRSMHLFKHVSSTAVVYDKYVATEKTHVTYPRMLLPRTEKILAMHALQCIWSSCVV